MIESTLILPEFPATFVLKILSNVHMEEDRAIVSKVLQGDMLAFRRLINQNERLVCRMIGRLVKSSGDIEELCQDVFIKVYDKLAEFNFQSRLSTWIATIAYRHAINHLKKQKMLMVEFQEIDFTGKYIDKVNPEVIMEDQDMDNMILQLTEHLPPCYKTVLLLYHMDGMSYDEIGKVTGMPEGTVKSYIYRARKLLKEIVIRYLGKEELS